MLSIILQTERLLLRPPVAADISCFVPLLNDFEISKNLSRAPHPYTEDDGCAWVVRTAGERVRGDSYPFVVMDKNEDKLLGMCAVHPHLDFMLGYWIGKPHWGQGYATEAVRRVAEFAFDELGCNELTANWMHDNPASGRVLEKIGCRPNGTEERDCLS
ncbi:MAG: GNAT family N-acetyltransferase, partial [Micropepsaceae bacterium]